MRVRTRVLSAHSRVCRRVHLTCIAIPSSTAGSPVSASSQPKTWSFYAVSVPASRKRADGGATPQVLVVEAAGGCASALDVFVRRGDYPTPASFDASSAQFRGGPNNTIVLVNGTQSAWPQGTTSSRPADVTHSRLPANRCGARGLEIGQAARGMWASTTGSRRRARSRSPHSSMPASIWSRPAPSSAAPSRYGAITTYQSLSFCSAHDRTWLQAGGYSFFYYSATKSATYYAHLTVRSPHRVSIHACVSHSGTAHDTTHDARHSQGPEKGSLNLYARIGQYPTRYESTASAVSKGSAAVQASVALKSGQSAYFAVYNPTSTAASFSVTVDSCTPAQRPT